MRLFELKEASLILYEKALVNIYLQYPYKKFSGINPNNTLSELFTWITSKEGYEFWHLINKNEIEEANKLFFEPDTYRKNENFLSVQPTNVAIPAINNISYNKVIIKYLESIGGKNLLKLAGGALPSYFYYIENTTFIIKCKRNIPDGYKIITLSDSYHKKIEPPWISEKSSITLEDAEKKKKNENSNVKTKVSTITVNFQFKSKKKKTILSI